MCFTATASFTASAVLTPIGLYTLSLARRGHRHYLALAAFPLLFGLQQAIEGGLWLALAGQVAIDTRAMALGFLLFAYFLWPLLVPLAALMVEKGPFRRGLFMLFTMIGGLFGASLYLPLVLNADWMSLRIVEGSILYQPVLLYDGLIPRTAVRVVYALIVALPLLLATVSALRRFGLLILGSVIGSGLFFAYAFVSIWCFIAAILSLYVLHVVRQQGAVRPASANPPQRLADRA